MNKFGFTFFKVFGIIFFVSFLILIIFFISKDAIEKTNQKAFVDFVNKISKSSITKYASEGIYSDDDNLYNELSNKDGYFDKSCYNIRSLVPDYMKSIDNDFVGSVEVCHGEACGYQTKIWISDHEYFIDGAKDEVEISDLKDNIMYYNSCGIKIK